MASFWDFLLLISFKSVCLHFYLKSEFCVFLGISRWVSLLSPPMPHRTPSLTEPSVWVQLSSVAMLTSLCLLINSFAQTMPPCFVFQKLHSNLGVVSPLSSRWPVLHLGMKMSLSFLSWPEVGVPSFLSIRKFFPQCNSPRETLSSCKLKCLCRKPTYISIPYTTGWPNALLDASFKTMEKA